LFRFSSISAGFLVVFGLSPASACSSISTSHLFSIFLFCSFLSHSYCLSASYINSPSVDVSIIFYSPLFCSVFYNTYGFCILVLSCMWSFIFTVSGMVCKYLGEGDLSQTLLLPQEGKKLSVFNELEAKVD
jgi:hypothetical protein